MLRDSSMLGARGKSSNLEWQNENMIDKNVFRLNWHATDEKENPVAVDKLPDGKSYLELIMEKSLV